MFVESFPLTGALCSDLCRTLTAAPLLMMPALSSTWVGLSHLSLPWVWLPRPGS